VARNKIGEVEFKILDFEEGFLASGEIFKRRGLIG